MTLHAYRWLSLATVGGIRMRNYIGLAAIGTSAVVVIALLSWPIGMAGPDATLAKPSVSKEQSFADKALAVWTRQEGKSEGREGSYGGYLEKAQLRTVGGRTFLVGKGVDITSSENPYKGRSVWIAWSD